MHLVDGLGGDGRGGAEVGATLELDPEVEPAEHQGTERHQDQDRRDGVPAPTLGEEVVGDLAGVEPVPQLTELGHQTSFPVLAAAAPPTVWAPPARWAGAGLPLEVRRRAPGRACTPRC